MDDVHDMDNSNDDNNEDSYGGFSDEMRDTKMDQVKIDKSSQGKADDQSDQQQQFKEEIISDYDDDDFEF